MLFGAFVPQGWRMDLVGVDGAWNQWQTMVSRAQQFEKAGWDSLWLFDHFHTIPDATQEPTFECWTACAGLAQATSRIRIGQMVGCNMYRHPTVMAKIASTLDVISNGRLDFGLGAGWYVHETVAYGFEFPPPGQRLDMLDEALAIIRGMFTQQLFRFDGKYYQVGSGHVPNIFRGGEIDIEGVICQPKPVQQHVPFWVGGGGEKKTLKIVAKHGDWANYFAADIDTVKHKNAVLDEHCNALGRDPATVKRSVCVEVLFGTAEEAARRQHRRLSGAALTETSAQPMIDRLARYKTEGRIECLIVYFPDAADGDSPQRFWEEVVPALR
jgi:alkanesulfonate monooxygenase SsuD/methylene tetrahydromethanopterin reductase-like flavin-dependent oxidoreductase (luciferase family)